MYLNGIALSKFAAYGTPVGDIPLDLDGEPQRNPLPLPLSLTPSPAIADLRRTKQFSDMRSSTDEDEHSLEMHLPYIRHIFEGYAYSMSRTDNTDATTSSSSPSSLAIRPRARAMPFRPRWPSTGLMRRRFSSSAVTFATGTFSIEGGG
jgi:hypothetical protein